ncbi:hypothetical protein [Legionella worsleiensis]|uniref:Secreted protein n=1 Tax=Legionella worsleiensis TaxID=45076 RepID=A0A0W1ALE3_9GAMM|nr:hypothetical protein [Legionella worsleiensis]KTD82137.1 hypothetical protein Lwor_0057 [Legionella worsleiensis]STY31395.1 Uncharacterised protein [Legionella worsleiensis]
MKLKSLLIVVCFSFFSHAFAANMHLNPNADSKDKQSIEKSVAYPGYCQIEIINQSFTDVTVFGTFDDGSTVDFNIYRYESPHYISLFYNFYCHSGMYITITSPYYTLYSGWTNVNSTIRVVPYLKQAKVELSTR